MNVPAWALTIAAAVTAGPAYLAAWNSVHNRRQLKIPSGGTAGEKIELTHDLAAVNAADLATVAQPSLQTAIEHINGADDSPVKVENGPKEE